MKRRLSDIDAIENEDFQGVEISTPSGQTKKDHIIKLDAAKEMAMLERNEKGLSDIDAIENEDFQGVEISTPSGQTKKDHIIKLDAAKEMAMLERNEKGKQVRRYFIQVEKKYKAASLATQELSPQLQVMINLEIEQKRQAEKLEHVEERIESIREVVAIDTTSWREDTDISFR